MSELLSELSELSTNQRQIIKNAAPRVADVVDIQLLYTRRLDMLYSYFYQLKKLELIV